MDSDNLKLNQRTPRSGAGAVDFDFLARQTFDDTALQREVLELFVAQARRITSALGHLSPREQGDAAHLLTGSARGIGAWQAAEAASAYGCAAPEARAGLFAPLVAAFADVEMAIDLRLKSIPA